MEMKYEGINLKPADNGGFVLSFHTHRPHLKNSCSHYKDHTELFTEAEEEKAMARLIELHKGNITHYKEMMSKKKKSNPGNLQPMPAHT